MISAKTVAGYAALIAVGFVAIKVAMKVKDGLDAGGKAVDAVKDAAVKAITEDLNPASDKNIVYSGANAVVSAVAGRETNVGGEIWEGVQWLKAKLGMLPNSSDESNTAKQAENMMKAQEEFRASEMAVAAEAAREAALVEQTIGEKRSAFRLSEITEQNYGVPDRAVFGMYPKAF